DGTVTNAATTCTGRGARTSRSAGRYVAWVTITSALGFAVTQSANVTVADAALTAAAAAPLRGRQNQPLTNATVATFTDANPNAKPADFAAQIDWGDGQTSAGTISARPRRPLPP